MTETILGMPAWLFCLEAWGVGVVILLALAVWRESR